jgi:transposase
MAQAFSDDLRRRILQTYERENMSLPAVAERFSVSYDYVKKIRQHQLKTNQMERTPQSRYGRVSRVTPDVQKQMKGEVHEQPDITLQELKERMHKTQKVRLSRSLLWLWLERLGLRRKKNRSTRKNVTRKRTGSGANSSWKRSVPFGRNS